MAADSLWRLGAASLHPARLQNVSLEIGVGVTAVLGWSGAGKTSLLNLLVGFEQPDAGQIHRGSNLKVAWVPQNNGLWPQCRVREHLEVAGATIEKADSLLNAFDLTHHGTKFPDTLSEGEQSRLAVARALAMSAPVLVMDEPLVHVDPARHGKYWQVIREHSRMNNTSLLFSTHLPETVLAEADQVICLKDGRVLHAGLVLDLYHNPLSPELMECLGPGNWLSVEDSRHWLEVENSKPACIRPEQISIDPSANGSCVVESARFMGSVAECKLRKGDVTRRFFHRPAAPNLTAGARAMITLRLMLLLAICLFAGSGCNLRSSDSLAIREWQSWVLPPDGSMLPTPRSLAISQAGEILVLDTAGRVLVYNSGGVLQRQWKMLETSVGKPEGLVGLKDGRVIVCDTHYHRIVTFDREGHWLANFGKEGKGSGEFIYPVGITKDDAENLYICEYGGNDRVQKFTREGKWISSFGSFGTGPGQFQRPSGIAWHAGKLYVADAINNRVLIFTDSGEYCGLLGGSEKPLDLGLPYGVHAGSDGRIYVIEYGAGRLSLLSPDGRLLGQLGKTGSGTGEFATPWGLTIDPQGHVLVADTKNRRIVSLRL